MAEQGRLRCGVHTAEVGEQDTAGWADRDAIAAAVGVVALSIDQATTLEVVDEPDHVALVDVEAVAEVALAQRAEVVQRREHTEVGRADVVFGEGVGQQAQRGLGDLRGEVGGSARERGWAADGGIGSWWHGQMVAICNHLSESGGVHTDEPALSKPQ